MADDRGVDMKWFPKDSDGQIKMGFNIIANAFKTKVRGLEDELRASNDIRSELEEKLTTMRAKVSKLEREHVDAAVIQSRLNEMERTFVEKVADLDNQIIDLMKREQSLVSENRRLGDHFKSLQKKASQLETFRRIVVETIKKEDEGGFDDLDAKMAVELASSIHDSKSLFSTSTRITDSQPLQETEKSMPSIESDFRKLLATARTSLEPRQFQLLAEITRRVSDKDISMDAGLDEITKLCGYDSKIIKEYRTVMQKRGAQSRVVRNCPD